MIAQEHAPLARRTLKELPFRQHMIHMALGMTGEIGELIDAVKKVAIYGKAVDPVNYMEEVGDVLWYVSNLLPELQVPATVFQQALDDGFIQGNIRRQAYLLEGEDGIFVLAEDLLNLNVGVASLASAGLLAPNIRPGGSDAVRIIEAAGGLVGTVAGILGVDTAQAMDRNIAKLAKRYGDKFSDVAATNRDLEGERAILEGSPEMQANIAANKELHAENLKETRSFDPAVRLADTTTSTGLWPLGGTVKDAVQEVVTGSSPTSLS